jgi:hypothetical protein
LREEPAVIVQGEKDLRLAVPCWMLDEEWCRAMVVEEKPRIAVEALVALRDLLARQHSSTGAAEVECGTMKATEDHHESQTEDQTLGADAAPTDS